ncbi:MAG TPA: FAD-dependent thymidylate synthase [Chloroflexota bacterium]|nr:FAD-dependent thymidylate synthase [Chloroflexota bacterium]
MSDERRIFSVIGTLPEPGGYAIAKFSRSARPYQEWVSELSQEGASRFYEQFYFAYGHSSIADLAHVTMITENVSIVAAIEILDEQLVDAQESSTRYQDFTRRRYYTPPELRGSPLEGAFAQTCDRLFSAYRTVHRTVLEHFERRYADQRPKEMGDDEYRRTVRARAFDVARYLLPSSTYTGLGYICSARTLERQIRRLASLPLGELKEIAAELRAAASEPAYNPPAIRLDAEIAAFLQRTPDPNAADFVDRAREIVATGAAAAPTLVRYTEASPYVTATYGELRRQAALLPRDEAPDGTRGVTLVQPSDLRTELAATLLYRASNLAYEQILNAIRSWPVERLDGLAATAFASRGPHDEPIRETRVGHQLIFDLCIDNGAFRDLHRHRNCIQIVKDFTPAYGYDVPAAVVDADVADDYCAAMEEAGDVAARIEDAAPGIGQYALPLGYRRRALFKMDLAELIYIVETRSKPAGHFSYREIAHQMLDEVRKRYPSLARFVRSTDPDVDGFFER